MNRWKPVPANVYQSDCPYQVHTFKAPMSGKVWHTLVMLPEFNNGHRKVIQRSCKRAGLVKQRAELNTRWLLDNHGQGNLGL